MDKLQQFYEVIRQEMAVTLATATADSVTMRTVSPVEYRGSILIFTAAESNKYRQLQTNAHGCLGAGPFFAEVTAEFPGPTMLPENAELRAAYSAKFPGAFDEGVTFGGRDAEFILLKPTRLSGWAFENDVPNEEGIPTLPFAIEL